MRSPQHSIAATVLLLPLLWLSAPQAAGGAEIGTGPPVESPIVATSFQVTGRPDAVFIAWRDAAGIHSGALNLQDESFDEFPLQPIGYVTNLRVGIGGPPDNRRAYLTWVGNTLELMLVVFDADGNVIGAPHQIASSVQVVPVKIVPTDTGALIACAWDADPYWDPRVVEIDLDGQVLGQRVVEDALFPEQTLGVALAATPDGDHALVHIVSDTHDVHLRRYDGAGPIDGAPILVSPDGGSDYVPFAPLFDPPGGDPFIQIAFPYLSSDLRFAHAALAGGPVALGPVLSDLVPEFPGSAADVAGLAGSPEIAIVIWQEVELDYGCGCSIPPPIRVEFIAQAIVAGESPEALHAPFTVFLWQEGDAIGAPETPPILAPSATPGRFTVVWSDERIRFTTVDVPTGASVDSPVNDLARLFTLEPNRPNPFSPRTAFRYSLAHLGPVELTVLDAQGRAILTLASGEQSAGQHEVVWDGRDTDGLPLPAGIYFVRLDFAGRTETRKVALIR